MNEVKRISKDSKILIAAEKIFADVGFRNAKMEDIAKVAGITKVTLYTYFQSKENLYLALAYKALTALTDQYYETIERNKDKSGCEGALALLEAFMIFCENNHLYAEILLDYYSLVRSTANGTNKARMTDGVKDSIYWLKLQELHNLPFKLSIKELERGKKDGTILTEVDSALATVQGWSMVMGYVKIRGASGNVSIFKVNMDDVKMVMLQLTRKFFESQKIE